MAPSLTVDDKTRIVRREYLVANVIAYQDFMGFNIFHLNQDELYEKMSQKKKMPIDLDRMLAFYHNMRLLLESEISDENNGNFLHINMLIASASYPDILDRSRLCVEKEFDKNLKLTMNPNFNDIRGVLHSLAKDACFSSSINIFDDDKIEPLFEECLEAEHPVLEFDPLDFLYLHAIFISFKTINDFEIDVNTIVKSEDKKPTQDEVFAVISHLVENVKKYDN